MAPRVETTVIHMGQQSSGKKLSSGHACIQDAEVSGRIIDPRRKLTRIGSQFKESCLKRTEE